MPLHRADAVTEDITAEIHRKRARAEGRKRLSEGPRRAMGPTRTSTFWWYLHLSTLGIRIMLQAAQQMGKHLNEPESWEHLNRGWMDAIRRVAAVHAYRKGMREEPEECGKLPSVEHSVMSQNAVFLSRWFTVPRQGAVSLDSWTLAELRELGAATARSVDENSTAWPHHPDGWRESLELLREGVEQQ